MAPPKSKSGKSVTQSAALAPTKSSPAASPKDKAKKGDVEKPKAVQSPKKSVAVVPPPPDPEKICIDLRDKIVTEWNKGSKRNSATLDTLLNNAKLVLTKLELIYLPLDKPITDKQLIISRDILEIGAKYSVSKQSTVGVTDFEGYVAQLKQYYFDLKPFIGKQSDCMYEILGMNLLKLLSQNRIAEFHSELELFLYPDTNLVLNNPYIRKAVEIEQFLTEGRYNKVVMMHAITDDDLKKNGLASPGFKYFVDCVIENSRGVIADVMEKAYPTLPAKFACQSLHLKNKESLKQMATERKWTLGEDSILRFPVDKDITATIPAAVLAEKSLKYAKDLELII